MPSGTSQAANYISFLSTLDNEIQKTYLNYNNVMKVAVTNPVLDEIVSTIKEDFGTGLNVIDKILSLLDENFVSAIKKGHYESFLDSIKSLSNEDNLINLSLNLGTFGFGENATALIKVDANANNNLVSITLNNAGLNGFYLNNTKIVLVDYLERSFSTDGYYFLEKVPTIIDQIYNIYSAPKFHLAIEGSYKDSNGVGLSAIKGEANLLGHNTNTGEITTLYEFDQGYFDLKLTQQVGVNNSDGTFNKLGDSKNHHVSLDLEKIETAYFHYYDEDLLANSKEEGTYGKLSVEPYQDVVDIIKEIYNSNDPRFSKWFKVVANASSSSVIDAVKTGRYSPILATNLIVSSTFSDDYAKLVLSGSAFGFNDDTNNNDFSVTFTYDGEKIKTLSLENVVTNGKTLNLKITLSDYDESKTTCVDHSKTTTDFTGFAPLISDIYNTANLKTYHLTTDDLGISLGISIKLSLDFRIFVDGSIVKVYGTICTPTSWTYSSDYYNVIVGGYRNCVFYFDDINPDTGKAYEDNSGYAYLTYNISKNKNDFSGGKKSGTYKYYSTYFQDTTNLMTFLFSHVMGLKSSYVDDIVNSINKTDESKDAKAINFEKLITSFSYDETNRTWDIGIAIQYLIKDDTLKNMTIKIYSSKVDSKYLLSKLYLKCTLASIVTISGNITNGNLGEDNWSSINDTYNTFINNNRSKAVDYK